MFYPPRKLPLKIMRFMVICTVFLLITSCASGPDKLAKQLQKALDSGDMDAALQLTKLDDAPASLRFFYMDAVVECSNEVKCTVSMAKVDEEYKQREASQARELGAEMTVPVEGLVVINQSSPDGKLKGTVKMPYAKVDGQYKIVSMRYTAAKLAELRAKSTESIIDEILAAGVRDASGTVRTDWKATARKLSEGGEEPGLWFNRQTTALAAAAKAGDPNAAMRAGDKWSQMVFRDKELDGKIIPEKIRKLKLKAQSVRFLTELKILGGYQLDNQAVLIIEGTDGSGWVKRGGIVMEKYGDDWEIVGDRTVNHPRF